MSRKQSSPLCLNCSSCLTALLVSCLVVLSSSAPLIKRDTRPLHMDDIGAYFRMVVKEVDVVQSNLSLDLNGTMFDDLVCPLFGIYSRMQQTLLSLSEHDWRNHSVSVLTFVFERQTESLCERVKANCTEDQLCANMDCNVSSIAQSCLHIAPPADLVNGLWGEDEHQNRENRDMIPLWLGEILSNGYPDEDILDTVVNVLEYNTFVECTIPEDGSSEPIECNDTF